MSLLRLPNVGCVGRLWDLRRVRLGGWSGSIYRSRLCGRCKPWEPELCEEKVARKGWVD